MQTIKDRMNKKNSKKKRNKYRVLVSGAGLGMMTPSRSHTLGTDQAGSHLDSPTVVVRFQM